MLVKVVGGATLVAANIHVIAGNTATTESYHYEQRQRAPLSQSQIERQEVRPLGRNISE